LRIPSASPHIHSLSPHGTHYDLGELPIHSLKDVEHPSSRHTTDLVLQKGEFKPKYVKVKKYLPGSSFVLSYVRRSDYTPSTMSREMQNMYDRVSIHTASPESQNLEGFTSFYNPYQLLRTEQNLHQNPITSIVQLDSQIMPFKGISELPESSKRLQTMRPIPPYMHIKEDVSPKLTQEEWQQNLQEYDQILQTKKDKELIKFTQQYQEPFQQVETPQATLQVSNTQQQFLPQIQNTSGTAQQFQNPPQNTLGMPLERQNSKTPKYQYAFDISQQSQTPIRPQVQTQSQIVQPQQSEMYQVPFGIVYTTNQPTQTTTSRLQTPKVQTITPQMQNMQKNPYYNPTQGLSLGNEQNQEQNFMSYTHVAQSTLQTIPLQHVPQQIQTQTLPQQYQTSYQQPQVKFQQPMVQSGYLPTQQLNP